MAEGGRQGGVEVVEAEEVGEHDGEVEMWMELDNSMMM